MNLLKLLCGDEPVVTQHLLMTWDAKAEVGWSGLERAGSSGYARVARSQQLACVGKRRW